jgi:hypothetical protein
VPCGLPRPPALGTGTPSIALTCDAASTDPAFALSPHHEIRAAAAAAAAAAAEAGMTAFRDRAFD